MANAAASASSALAAPTTGTLNGSAPWSIFPRKRLDISYYDFGYSALQCLKVGESQRADLVRQIEEYWSPEGNAMVLLSVRTALDLLLRTLAFPPGTEIIMSGITISGMVHIVEAHGLIPIAVDMHQDTLAPSVDDIRAAIGPNTKLILIAHIFGALIPLDEIAAVAHESGVMLIEDCAEAYVGPDYRGNDASDITLFSFGTIKNSTALGGALMRVHDRQLLADMRVINASYIPRSNAFFLKRTLKYIACQAAMSPATFGALLRTANTIGLDHEELITALARGFPGPQLIRLIRQRPSVPLLALLWRRLSNFDDAYFQRRCKMCEHAAAFVTQANIPGMKTPGSKADFHGYWLFPVLLPEWVDRDAVCASMLSMGFDVTPGTTQLGPVEKYVTDPTPKFKSFPLDEARTMMARIIYLPIYPELPMWALDKLLLQLKNLVEAEASRRAPPRARL